MNSVSESTMTPLDLPEESETPVTPESSVVLPESSVRQPSSSPSLIVHRRASSISFGMNPHEANSSGDGPLSVSLNAGYKETKAVISQHTLANLNNSGFGSGNISPSILPGIQSPERRTHRHTTSLESMEMVPSKVEESECSERGSEGSVKQNNVLQLVINFEREEESAVEKVSVERWDN